MPNILHFHGKLIQGVAVNEQGLISRRYSKDYTNLKKKKKRPERSGIKWKEQQVQTSVWLLPAGETWEI